MIALHSMNYTSLKDLMPESPPSTASPTCCLGDSWREIPIKDPLLQHAAWAYLQPMTGERQSEDHRCWRRLFHQKFCWLLSCFNDVVLVVFEGWFPHHVRERLMIKFNLSDERESDKEGKC
ncbi:hypothetical protein C2S53_017789 [Perilla frutescens var. hirtella]|uniref:Uncharacterized protein n=1 Tax=Perilla frutescens var. hirtella TaxID=608512 RepID=A0AAD4P229_PERFH|nr:hypothetical protein C2S53_017789 [Perilla frutescens var. hirtella]